jgi:uncharacterized protein (TIGR02594 family)
MEEDTMPRFTFTGLASEYKRLWDQAKIRPEKAATVAASVKQLRELKPSYDQVNSITTVPWYVVGLIHSLEASFSVNTHLHNGDPLSARTIHVPAGRPKQGNPPFSWVASAVDALTLKGLQNVGKDAWSIERIAYELERYNGFGYRNNHPAVNTPYLWSCTDQYTKGKYIGDHKFDPDAVSKQVGAMALLKQLISENAVEATAQANVPPPKPPPPPVPVPTGLFLADTVTFGLRAEARIDAAHTLSVMTDMPVRKLEEAAAPWWKVEVTAPDSSKHVGFAQRDWLKEQTVLSSFAPEDFAQTCLDVARRYGTSAHFLLASADAETGMANTAAAGAGDAFGPFALTEGEWKANNDPAETGFGDEGRFEPPGQAAVAGRLIVKLADDARNNLPDKRLATSEELYLVRIFGPAALPGLLDENAQDKPVRGALAPATPTDIDAIFARRPALLTTGITVRTLRQAITQKLEAGFDNAVALILKVEPDLVIGPPETVDEPREVPSMVEMKDVPWIAKAKEELNKPVVAFSVGSNPEIEKYFEATPLGREPDDVAWCAAFVSWCIRAVGGSKKHVVYSARAADWLENGDPLPGPQYGAVAVTKPLVSKSSGHVGFVVAWDDTKVTFLAGNQTNKNGQHAVCEKEFHIGDIRGWRMV